jgi:iron(III) transport system permease protein
MISSRVNPLLVVSAAVAALVGLPVASVLTHILSGGTGTTWSHLAQPCCRTTSQTRWYCASTVGLGVIVLGVSTAWLTDDAFISRDERSSSGHWSCRLAMPAYVLAYVYTDFLQFVGPLQSFLREYFRLEQGGLLVSRSSQPGRRGHHVRLRSLSRMSIC